MILRSFFFVSVSSILISIMLGTLLSCRDDNGLSALLDRGDSLVTKHPDSVLAMLDSIRDEVVKSPESLRMRYELLLADAQNKAYVDFTTDSVMKEVVDYYDTHGTPNQKMKAHYLLGCTYRDMGESPLALESYQNAVDCVDTTSADCDFYNLASVYGQMAEMYRKQFLAENALDAYIHFENNCIKAKDSLNAMQALLYRAGIYKNIYKDKDDSVFSLSIKSHQWFISHNYVSLAAEHVAPMVSYYIEHGNYYEANKYLYEYETKSNIVDSHGCVPDYASTYYYHKGILLLNNSRYDSARIFFSRLLTCNKKELAYRGYLKLYTHLNQPDSIAKYANLYVAANDSSFLNKNTEDLLRISSMYKYGRVQKISRENAELYAKSQTHKFYLACVILTLFIAIVLIVILYKKRHKTNIEHIRQLAYQLESNKDKLHFILAEAEEKSVSLNRKDEEINHLQEQIQNMKAVLSSTSKEMIIQSFYNTDIYGIIKTKSQYGSNWQPVTAEEWQMLISKFRIYYSRYSSFLSLNTNLTDEQYKVCMLLALNFRESEIALLFEVDSARINKLKIQVNTKLFAKQDAKSLRKNLSKHY